MSHDGGGGDWNDATEGRGRRASITDIDAMYGHQSRSDERFEMNNPLLDASASRTAHETVAPHPLGGDHRNSKYEGHAPIEARLSGYRASIDQARLLERHNTRHSGSMRRTSHHVPSEPTAVDEASVAAARARIEMMDNNLVGFFRAHPPRGGVRVASQAPEERARVILEKFTLVEIASALYKLYGEVPGGFEEFVPVTDIMHAAVPRNGRASMPPLQSPRNGRASMPPLHR